MPRDLTNTYYLHFTAKYINLPHHFSVHIGLFIQVGCQCTKVTVLHGEDSHYSYNSYHFLRYISIKETVKPSRALTVYLQRVAEHYLKPHLHSQGDGGKIKNQDPGEEKRPEAADK